MIDIYASAIIYMPLHERSKILKSIINIHKSLEKNFQSYEIILVNDSGNLISNSDQDLLKARDVKNITILNMAYFHDRENAMLAGTDLSNGDFIFEFDYTITNIKITTLVDLYNLSVENDADIVAFYN